MKGLELSEEYYKDLCLPMLNRDFPQEVEKIAVGLVGEGSECYGYDDEISRDHDWGPSICLWLTAKDYQAFGNRLQEALLQLPSSYQGFHVRQETELAAGRTGVLEMGSFYRKFLGTESVPSSLAQWRIIPENHLSTVTNGKIFADPLGKFSEIRNNLINDYYPEDIRIKKIAARCITIAQAGQYNYPRTLKRYEYVGAYLTAAEFINASISIVYLLNKKYQPYYKWMHHGLPELPLLGKKLYDMLNDFVNIESAQYEANINRIEEFCEMIIVVLQQQGLSEIRSDFLLDHGLSVHQKIENLDLRRSNPWVE